MGVNRLGLEKQMRRLWAFELGGQTDNKLVFLSEDHSKLLNKLPATSAFWRQGMPYTR